MKKIITLSLFASLTFADVEPLVKTKWDQSYPYNKYMPKIDDKSTLAGCVQVAMAQIMNYHKFPSSSTGMLTHSWNNEVLNSILYKSYNWDQYPDTLELNSSNYIIDEIAYLLRDLGIVNKATFGTDTTGANINFNALNNYKYSTDLSRLYQLGSGNETFLNTIKSQLDNNLPVILSFKSAYHMVVVDGYRYDDSDNLEFHINFGWGGKEDGYYNLLNPFNITSSSISYNFNLDEAVLVYNIYPCSESKGDCAINLEQNDIINGTNINGTFDSDINVDSYELYLDGETTISGSRGYTNQAFFISLYDSDKVLIKEDDSTLSENLQAGKYFVDISLCDAEYSLCYANSDDNFKNYSVNISSNTLSNEQIESINSSLDKPPVIDIDYENIFFDSNGSKTYLNILDPNGDSVNLSVSSLHDTVNIDIENNIMNLSPKNTQGVDTITITADSTSYSVSKNIDILISDQNIHFGDDFSLNGTFLEQDQFDKHNVILEGDCSIEGFNGYTNQAFFISTLDTNESYISNMVNETINEYYSLDTYKIGASLRKDPINKTGEYYQFSQANDYMINVSCKNSSSNVYDIASLLNIDNTDTTTQTDKNITLKTNWNFVSIDANLSELNNSNISIVWGYEGNNWYAYSPDENISEQISNNNISPLTNIQKMQGYWVKALDETTLKTNISDQNQITAQYSNWNLLGNSSSSLIDMENISCTEGSVKLAWKYINDEWQIYYPGKNIDTFENFDNVGKNEAVWIMCK